MLHEIWRNIQSAENPIHKQHLQLQRALFLIGEVRSLLKALSKCKLAFRQGDGVNSDGSRIASYTKPHNIYVAFSPYSPLSRSLLISRPDHGALSITLEFQLFAAPSDLLVQSVFFYKNVSFKMAFSGIISRSVLFDTKGEFYSSNSDS